MGHRTSYFNAHARAARHSFGAYKFQGPKTKRPTQKTQISALAITSFRLAQRARVVSLLGVLASISVGGVLCYGAPSLMAEDMATDVAAVPAAEQPKKLPRGIVLGPDGKP